MTPDSDVVASFNRITDSLKCLERQIQTGIELTKEQEATLKGYLEFLCRLGTPAAAVIIISIDRVRSQNEQLRSCDQIENLEEEYYEIERRLRDPSLPTESRIALAVRQREVSETLRIKLI